MDVAQNSRSAYDGIVKQEVAENGVARQYSPPSNISIAQFFEKINISDKSFLKYIPDGFLSAEQIEAKNLALAKDGAKHGKDTDKKKTTFPEIGSKSVSTMISSRYGSAAMDYLNQLIKDLNGAKSFQGPLSRLGAFLMGNFKKTAVAASLSVAI